jgi:hypothetical protein
MSQLFTLIWLKWRLFRNSLRSSKAIVNKAASVLGMLVALALALVVALILGVVSYALTQPETVDELFRRSGAANIPAAASVEFILFSIFGIIYLMWATVPLSIGGSKQFDAGKLLMYPITLRKLFVVDFVSELTTLHSVFAVPAVLGLCVGAGLGSGNLTTALIAAVPATLFGVGLSKWLSTIMGSLLRRKRARGETIVALIGAVIGLGGAAAGQLAPVLFKHAESFRALRWTPPGAAALLLMANGGDTLAYTSAFLTLSAYAAVLIVATYWIARRAALGLEGKRKRKALVEQPATIEGYAGWQIPLLPTDLSAIVEKEFRYAMRNAQVRMMALMPLILIIIRLLNSKSWGTARPEAAHDFFAYGSGLITAGGVLYVFLILAGISCNGFAFEENGMRTLILSPIDRRKIILGKNIALVVIALIFAIALLILNAIIFGGFSISDLFFTLLSFVIFATISSTIGNWLSINFPKRMNFGKRMNVSGVAGLLLIPMVILLSIPPVIAALVGYLSRSLTAEFMTLSLMVLVSIAVYRVVINFHGRSLERREVDILEVVREPADE